MDVAMGFAPLSNLKVRIELTYRCNLRCRMCDFSLPKNLREKRTGGPIRDMPDRIFERICDEILPYVKECILGIRAEPMMSRKFKEQLRLIVERGVPIIQIHTNGTLMTEEVSQLICDLGVNTVIISVDGIKKETYEDIRSNGNFDKLMRNIKRLVEIRSDSFYPIIQWNFVMMRRNIRELPGLIDLAADMKAQVVHAFHMRVHHELNISGESCCFCLEETNAVIELAKERAVKRDIILHFPFPKPAPGCQEIDTSAQELNSISANYLTGPICGYPWHEIVINQIGHVFPCPFWYKDPPLGDLTRERFIDIWNGKLYRSLRQTPTDKIANFSCDHCPVVAFKLGQSDKLFQVLP
jgi:radical SAM protein with 4Fe4S-binding SPASM domain